MSLTLQERAAVALRTVDKPEAKRLLAALQEREIVWQKCKRVQGIGSWWVDVLVYQYRLPAEEGEGWGVATVYFDTMSCTFYQQKQGLKIKWEKGVL